MLLLKKAAAAAILVALFSPPALRGSHARTHLHPRSTANPTADAQIKEQVKTFATSGCHNALLKTRVTSPEDQMPLRI